MQLLLECEAEAIECGLGSAGTGCDGSAMTATAGSLATVLIYGIGPFAFYCLRFKRPCALGFSGMACEYYHRRCKL